MDSRGVPVSEVIMGEILEGEAVHRHEVAEAPGQVADTQDRIRHGRPSPAREQGSHR
jgi:hypothetical protein